MALLDDQEIPVWRWEPRDARRDRQQQQFQQVVEAVRPAIEAGDVATARRILNQASPKRQRDAREQAKAIGKRVQDRWKGVLEPVAEGVSRPSQTDSRPRPWPTGPVVSPETLASVTRTPSQGAGPRAGETPSEALRRWEGEGGPIPTLTEAQESALGESERQAYRAAMGADDDGGGWRDRLRRTLKRAWSEPLSYDTPESPFEAIMTGGERNLTTIERLVSGRPAPTRDDRGESALPPGVKQVAQAAVDPMTYTPYALTKPAQLGRVAFGARPGATGQTARAAGAIFDDALLGAKGVVRNVGADAGARIGSEGANELLPEDMNPLLRGGIITAAGLAGGVSGWKSPEGLEAGARGYKATLGPEGTLVRGVERVAPGFGGSVIEDPAEAAARAARQAPAAPVNARITKTDTGKGYTTTDSAGRVREVPDAAPTAARAAVEAKREALKAPGPVFEKLPPVIRKGVALLNPAVGQDQAVLVAYRARQAVRAQLTTRFATDMRPFEDGVEQAMTASPPRYIGPEGTAQQNALIGTVKDVAERPHMYEIPQPLRQALDEYDRAQWDLVSSVARGEYGVPVRPYRGSQPGFVFTPTVRASDQIDDKLQAAVAGTGIRQGAKHRAYETAWDRVGKDPEFVPETDIRELSSVHTQAMASNAANETFRVGAGGKTGVEVVDELHPGLRQKKIELQGKLRSAKNSLQTAARQQGQAQHDAAQVKRLADQIARRMAPLEARIAALGDEYGPELSHLSGELYELRIQLARLGTQQAKAQGRAAGKVSAQVAIRREIDRLQKQVEKMVEAYQTADVEPYVFDRNTGRYYRPEAAKSVNELLKVPSGFGKSFVDLVDEIRAVNFAGDASPLTIQGVLGLFSDPVIAGRSLMRIFGKNPKEAFSAAALQRIAREEADDVAEYTFATGRQFGEQAPEFGLRQGRTAAGTSSEGFLRRGVGRKVFGERVGQRKGLGRIEKLGDIEEGFFAFVQRMMYEQWKHDRDLLLRDNPGMSRELAGAEAANLLSKVVPSLNPAERGVSSLRAAVERVPVTSMSFATSPALLAKDSGVGVIKLARAALLKLAKSPSADPATAWQTLSGREQLAIRRAITLAGTVATISMGSAVLSAPSRNMSPQDALKEQFNVNSRYFASIQFGDGRSIPIAGPFRSFVKALAPRSFDGTYFGNMPGYLTSKLNTPLRVPYDLVKGKDFYGNEIYEGNVARPENLLRVLWYGAESTAPISVGEVAGQARTGEISPRSAAEGFAWELAGTNYTPVKPTEKLNQIAREKFRGTKYEGMGFYELPPKEQHEIAKVNPKLWNEAVAEGNQERQQAERERVVFLEQQAKDDEALLAGTLSREDWFGGYASRRDQLTGATRAIYADAKERGGNWPILDEYYDQIDQAKVNGRVDWNRVNAWLAARSDAERTFIEENTGVRTKTPLLRLYSDLADEYYDLPRYLGMSGDQANSVDDLWQRVRNEAGSTDKVAMLRALRMLPDYDSLDPATVQGVRRRVMGLLRETTHREAWRRKHPESALVTGRGQLSVAQRKAIEDALSKR